MRDGTGRDGQLSQDRVGAVNATIPSGRPGETVQYLRRDETASGETIRVRGDSRRDGLGVEARIGGTVSVTSRRFELRTEQSTLRERRAIHIFFHGEPTSCPAEVVVVI